MKTLLKRFAPLCCLLLLCACGVVGGAEKEVNPWQEQYDLGLRYLSEGNYEEAILAFTAAIEIDPKQAPAYVGRGDAYILSGETEENLTAAQMDYERALGLDELLVEAWLGLVDIYIRQGEFDRALELAQESYKLTGDEYIFSILEDLGGSSADIAETADEVIGYDNQGNIRWRHIFTYDAQGRKDSISAFDNKGNQIGYLELNYTEDGQMLQSYSFDDETGRLMQRKLGYNSDGTLAEISIYNETGSIEQQTYFDKQGEVSSIHLFQYDEQGRYIGDNWVDADWNAIDVPYGGGIGE